jgi:hypothetical protein
LRAILVNDRDVVVGECDCPDNIRLIKFSNAFFVRDDSQRILIRKFSRFIQSPYFLPDAVRPARGQGQ